MRISNIIVGFCALTALACFTVAEAGVILPEPPPRAQKHLKKTNVVRINTGKYVGPGGRVITVKKELMQKGSLPDLAKAGIIGDMGQPVLDGKYKGPGGSEIIVRGGAIIGFR
jgi:hypothetical protein